jgi:hypothetical protein
VLLDADVIIDIHRLGIWEQITKRNKVYISSTILRKEVYFYEDEHGEPHTINLVKDVEINFQEVSTDVVSIQLFIKQFDRNIQDELHAGELEALSIIQNDRSLRFCTSDKMAIKAIGIIGLSSQGISFEELLKTSGITKKLEHKHTKEYFKKYLIEGSIIRIQRDKIQ